jgi:hypothetical protein
VSTIASYSGAAAEKLPPVQGYEPENVGEPVTASEVETAEHFDELAAAPIFLPCQVEEEAP